MKEFNDEEKRLISKYSTRIEDGKIYCYWSKKKNGIFHLPFENPYRYSLDDTCRYFEIPKYKIEQRATQLSGKTKKIEVKQPENFKVSGTEKLKIEDDGKKVIEISLTEPGGFVFLKFHFINAHWDKIIERNEQLYQMLMRKGDADLRANRLDLLEQIKRLSKHINKINERIANVLKVLAYETNKNIDLDQMIYDSTGVVMMNQLEKKKRIVNKLQKFFATAIVAGELSETIKEKWLPDLIDMNKDESEELKELFKIIKKKIFEEYDSKKKEERLTDLVNKNKDESEELKAATLFGVEKLTQERDSLINEAVRLAATYHTIEIVNRDKIIGENKSGINETISVSGNNDDNSGKVGRKPWYDKKIAIDYYEKNKNTLFPKWIKTNGKTAVARVILMKAYAGNNKKPHEQTIVGYIQELLSNSDN